MTKPMMGLRALVEKRERRRPAWRDGRVTRLALAAERLMELAVGAKTGAKAGAETGAKTGVESGEKSGDRPLRRE